MKWISIIMLNVRISIPVFALCLSGSFADEWKSLPIGLPAPVFSATQNKVLATFNGTIFELPSSDSVWKSKQSNAFGPVLAADSFHYFKNGTVLSPDSTRFPDLPSNPEYCCDYRFAEDAQRFYLRAGGGQTFYSEKSQAGWKPFSAAPPPSEAYRLMPFPSHYLMVGVGDISISRNRGATWENVKGLTDIIGSNYFVEEFGNDLFAGFVSSGLFRSKDGGQTWSQVFPNGSPYRFHDFNGMEASGDTIWLSGYGGNLFPGMPDFTWSLGILRSVDAGKNWAWYHQGLPNQASGTDGLTGEWYPTIGIHRAPGELWTSSLDGNGNGVPYRSRDGGKSWQAVTAGLNPGSSYYPESIGNEIRLRGADDYYEFDHQKNQWVIDTLLSPLKIRNLNTVGNTVYGQDQYFFQRKIGPSGKWENLFPIGLEGEFQYYPNGTEFIGMSYRPVFRMEHSDDGGRTWSSQRPFLPNTRYQNRKVEARGKALYWPDDSSFTPPEFWHEFDDSIVKVWNWQGGVLVQAGGRLFHTIQSGGTWQAISAPDTNLAFVIQENSLKGYSPSQIFTLAGSQWSSRKVHFPKPRILDLAKTRDYLLYTHSPQIAQEPPPSPPPAFTAPRAGYIGKTGAKASPYLYLNGETSMYSGGSYVFSSLFNTDTKRGILDTVNLSQVPAYFYSFTRWGVISPNISMAARALFADEDLMAAAYDGGKISYSMDRGKTWQAASSLPNINCFAGDAKMLFTVADMVLHQIRNTGAAWTSERVLAGNIRKVSGTPTFLAIITLDNRIQVTTDTAKTWTTLPALPLSQAIPTAIAAYGNQVFVGTQEYGIYSWGDGDVTSVKPGMGPGLAKSPMDNREGTGVSQRIPRGWFAVPRQPGRIINPKGQWRRLPPASAVHEPAGSGR